ncbi:Pentatricopeptide repeat-containing protein [Fulvia fulva]|uniref:Pentatricopeptide repeat-containing protein n=1 Tax=Passalora fulva TaxID=5499 RepID=A0A9Q8LAZ4_PASFU|nr:Pentatricopeptide repeat-containing protein [Fulvia fulva]KAK4631592.1 Pentatricopeptide repeat-containing protein [Fulvia fulva]KAK4632931.1 Pentatricopeptide repeat-containing protein [Fulvia fulva]UJO14107.1 Pentatricopeptide repeat-containing protein [Fulvia fulva]WPV11631.1 Pentatricopeptide repeat-containing protein [Fulvia fulva]WPV25567.1 Pentatricopeptide repeat-containing protein [Fulvia fulva]
MAGNTQNNTAFVNGVRSLVNMWRMTMARHLRRGSTVAAMETSGWDFLPSRTVFDQQVPRSHHMFEQMLGMLVPVPQSSASTTLDPAKILRNADYASSALVTLELLRSMERSKSSLPSEPDILPFVNLLSKLLKIAPAPRTPYSFQEKLFALKDDPAELAYYREMGNRLHLEHMQLPGPSHASEFGAEGSTPPSAADSLPGVEADPDHDALESAPTSDVSQTDRFALLHYKRLARALAQQDMLLAEKIKRETYAFAGSRGADSQALPLELYEHLMLTFLSLRNPKAAIEVWNHVIQAGYTPTVKTYSVMMRGAQAVRDVSGMKAFWQKMRNAGLQPDEHAWSIRIYGLIKLQLVKEGFQAMNEMAQEWMAAAKAREMKVASRERKKEMATNQNLGAELLAKYSGPVDGVPRPSLVVVNSAVSSLAQSQRGEIPKALTWARTFGVEPDITTYNVLLNVAMRYEQADEALKLLRHMQQRGVAADSATWTVLLTALFEGGFLEGLDHKQQQEKVLSFIKSLETNNPKMPGIDVKGYALVIDRLLKRYDNPEGAAAVMNHMVVRGLQPTTHIYTILMSSYFQRRPQPDLAAVEALWKYIESQNKGYGAPVDSVFYDRMIEGYATHHRLLPGGVSTALGFLKRCRQAGQKPGWRALEMVSRALAERQEWNQLKVLVDDVRSSLREGRGASQHMGQRNFWRFIIEGTDLLREEGITRPEDLLPSDPRRSPLLQAEASAEAL